MGKPIDKLEGKIKHCQAQLFKWSRIAFGNTTKALTEKKKKIEASRVDGNAGRVNG